MTARVHIAVLVLGAALAAALAPAASAATRFVPGEALVRYEPGTTAAARAAVRERADVALEDVLELPRTQLVSFDGSVSSAITRLERAADVLDAQPNYRYRATASAPNDTFFGDQWGIGAAPGVNVLPAWDRTRGSGQVIAIVDTGIDLTHPDLAPNLWTNPGEIPANGLDDDGNGKVDDVHGYDFVSSDPDPDDFQYHGTHVAGIAAAVAGNVQGVAGVAPDARLMAVRALDGDGFGTTAGVVQGIQYATQEGAGVINLSIGGPGGGSGDALFEQAIEDAGAANAVVVAAAGNGHGANNDTTPTVPCALPASNLICVAALDSSGALASYSNEGLETVDVGAPGSGILSSKTDWAAPLFTEDFEAGLGLWTHPPSTAAWGEVTPGAGGAGTAASDSPVGPYASNADARLTMASPVDLGGRRGCRMHFDAKYDIPSPDLLWVGARTDEAEVADAWPFRGSNGGSFIETEVSLSDLDGRSDVHPSFELYADAAMEGDGASVDNVRVLCRDQSYADSVVDADDYEGPGAGSYMRLNGTSMATPHVSGVAALVRAAAPGLAAPEVIDAIKRGGRLSGFLVGRTSSGKQVDAPGAINAALGPGTTTPVTPQSGGTTPSNTVLKKASRPGPAEFATRFRVDRRGRVTLRIAGDARVRGALTLRAGPRRGIVLRASFRTSTRGRALVLARLNRTGRRLLRRADGRLRARVRVVLTNAAGLRSITTQNPVVLATRR